MVRNRVLTTSDDSVPRVDTEGLGKPADFIVSLIQALLRAGYYTPEHPQSEKAKLGLYTKFHDLELKKGELSLLVRGEEKEKEILVDGMLEKPCRLKSLMPAGMAKMYDEKLLEFLERKELISLTLKQRMADREFYNFVDIMSAPILVDIHDSRKRDRFLSYLKEKRVKHISFIFDEDLVRNERKIPWRAWIAISRLRKDITLIPMLRDLDQEDLKQVQKEVVSDVLRPLGEPTSCFYTLVNTDIIETELMREEELEDAIVESLSRDMFFDTVQAFITNHTNLRKIVREEKYWSFPIFEEKILRLARCFAVRLNVLEHARGDLLLEHLFENRLILFDDLPARLQGKVKPKRFFNTFLDDPDGLLTRLEQIDGQKEYGALARSLFEIILPLLDEDKFREAFRIVRTLARHGEENTERGQEARRIIERVGGTDIPLKLKSKFIVGNKAARLALYPIFGYLEGFVIEHVIDLIRESEDQWVRKSAVELLIEMGPQASRHLEKALRDSAFDAAVTADIMQTLSTIKSKVVKGMMSPALTEFRQHDDPEVRRLAVLLLAEAQGAASEEMLIETLDDPSDLVREMAIKLLGIVGSERTLTVFSQLTDTEANSKPALSELLENQVFVALGSMENLPSEIGKTPEKVLLWVLEERGQAGGISGLFKKKGAALSDRSISIICESLGRVGTVLSEPVLDELAKGKKKSWSKKALEALDQIDQKSWSEDLEDDPTDSLLSLVTDDQGLGETEDVY